MTSIADALGQLAGLDVVKGHGTGNDFVLVPDLDHRFPISPVQVRALCDRHQGIGADGVLRVVRAADSAEVAEQAEHAHWFMDYRNGDGTTAEMCGNGARVFARYLVDSGLESGREFAIATRGGVCPVRIEDDGDVTIDMGEATPPTLRAMPVVSVGTSSWNGTGVFVPNPHCVVFLESVDDLADLDLTRAPAVGPPALYPDGVNVEFAVRVGAPEDRRVSMRVHERGVGETLACGTGACAVMYAAAARDGAPPATSYTVEMPGGVVTVSRRDDGHFLLRGPAVLVARVTLGGL